MADRLRLSNRTRLTRKIDAVFLKAARMLVIANGIGPHRGSPRKDKGPERSLRGKRPGVLASKLCLSLALKHNTVKDLQKSSGLRISLSRRTGNYPVIRTV